MTLTVKPDALLEHLLRHVLSVDADFDLHRGRQGRPLANLLRA